MSKGKLVHILEGFTMAKSVRIRNWLNIEKREWSDKFKVVCPEPSLAVQSQKDEADINVIVRNFGVTGKIPVGVRVPTYGDFDTVSDYREALEAVKSAEESFLSMPSDLRARLGHDPGAFVAWCADPVNLEEMRKLGLAPPAPVSASGSASS